MRADELATPRAEPSVRLSRASSASELWNFTAELEGGYRVFTWFFITNEGPGEQTAAALWYLVHPDGRVAVYQNGRVQGRWRLSPDRGRIDIASSSLDLRGPRHRVAIDSTSQRVKIDLCFGGDKLDAAAASAPAGDAVGSDTLQVAAPVDGTMWEGGMAAPLAVRGTATLTHVWTEESIPRVVLRRIEFFADSPGLAVYMSDITTPSGTTLRWLTLEQRGSVAYRSSNFEIALAPAIAPDRGYPIPGRLEVRDGGMHLDIEPQRVLLRTDPLDMVPQPFRLLFSLRVAPQWYWLDARFHLSVAAAGERPPIDVDGHGLLAVIFVNPLS